MAADGVPGGDTYVSTTLGVRALWLAWVCLGAVWGGGHHAVGGLPARQGAHAAILERRSRSRDDFNGLVVELDKRQAVAALWGDVDDPEPGLRFYQLPAMIPKRFTFGEPAFYSELPAAFWLTESPAKLSESLVNNLLWVNKPFPGKGSATTIREVYPDKRE